MEKENNFEMLDQPGKIAALITKAIVDYCMKSDTPVDITHIVNTMNDCKKSIDENNNPS